MNLLKRPPPSFFPRACVSCSECRFTSDCSERSTCSRQQRCLKASEARGADHAGRLQVTPAIQARHTQQALLARRPKPSLARPLARTRKGNAKVGSDIRIKPRHRGSKPTTGRPTPGSLAAAWPHRPEPRPRVVFRNTKRKGNWPRALTCSSLSLRSCNSRCFRIFGFSSANFLISSRSRSYRILESISRGN